MKGSRELIHLQEGFLISAISVFDLHGPGGIRDLVRDIFYIVTHPAGDHGHAVVHMYTDGDVDT